MPEGAEEGLARETDPAILAAEVRPRMPSVIADALAAPALLDAVVTPSHLPVMGCSMVIIRARRWRRHAGGRAPERPHVPPQRVEDMLLWKRKPVVIQDGERRVVVRRLR